MDGEREQPPSDSKTAGLAWLGISVAGAAVATFSVYLCHYSYVNGLAGTSWPAISAGVGLIAAFCMLTVTVIAGIRALIVHRKHRFWTALALVISAGSLVTLAGLVILGITL